MQWSSTLSRAVEIERAVDEIATASEAELGGAPDLAFLFASEHYRADLSRLPALLRMRLGGTRVLGCTASGVIAVSTEIEGERGLSLTAARLPGVSIDCWHLEGDDLRPGSAHSARCADLALPGSGGPGQFVVLADPISFPTPQLLRSLEGAFPSGVVVGGLASGGQSAGEIALFLDDAVHYSGAVLLALGGDIEMVTAVGQGCRPIGEPMFASAEGGKISALDGRPPMEVLSLLFENADEKDQALMQHSLFIGIAMQSEGSQYGQGDFLIRNLGGADQQTGAIWVAADLRDNQVVQFHLRDADTSAQDLDRCLERFRNELGADPAAGGLLFSCTGRGRGLYGRAGHDSGAFQASIGPLPLGGFFCNGEIGQVAGTTFLHAYTSAFAVFRERRGQPG